VAGAQSHRWREKKTAWNLCHAYPVVYLYDHLRDKCAADVTHVPPDIHVLALPLDAIESPYWAADGNDVQGERPARGFGLLHKKQEGHTVRHSTNRVLYEKRPQETAPRRSVDRRVVGRVDERRYAEHVRKQDELLAVQQCAGARLPSAVRKVDGDHSSGVILCPPPSAQYTVFIF
jgi:hypothetical protein